MKFHPFISIPVAALMITTAGYPVAAQDAKGATNTVQDAAEVMREFVISDRIPPRILQQSQGIAVFPGVIQAGFLLGGRRGDGVLILRNQDGSWSNPVLIAITGGSIGLQFGAQSSDVVMAFQDQESIRKVYDSKVRLGGSVSGTAGPVGANAVFPTDTTGNIYSYVRSKGLFGGVSLSGVNISFKDRDTAQLYGRSTVTPQQVFAGQNIKVPPVVYDFRQSVQQAVSAR
jgi:SH3 domain-containing YSC84-like protein 1